MVQSLFHLSEIFLRVQFIGSVLLAFPASQVQKSEPSHSSTDNRPAASARRALRRRAKASRQSSSSRKRGTEASSGLITPSTVVRCSVGWSLGVPSCLRLMRIACGATTRAAIHLCRSARILGGTALVRGRGPAPKTGAPCRWVGGGCAPPQLRPWARPSRVSPLRVRLGCSPDGDHGLAAHVPRLPDRLVQTAPRVQLERGRHPARDHPAAVVHRLPPAVGPAGYLGCYGGWKYGKLYAGVRCTN